MSQSETEICTESVPGPGPDPAAGEEEEWSRAPPITTNTRRPGGGQERLSVIVSPHPEVPQSEDDGGVYMLKCRENWHLINYLI